MPRLGELSREGALHGAVEWDDDVEPGESEDLEDSRSGDDHVEATLGLAHVLQGRDQNAEPG